MAQQFDHDIDYLVDKDERNIQPHLGSLKFKDSSALEHINPAFDDSDKNEVFTDNFNTKTNNQCFEDNFNDINIPPKLQSENQPVPSEEENEATNRTSYPVIFTNGGQKNVVQEEVIIKKPDGSKVIKTEQCYHYTSQPYQKRRRPLTKNRILLLKILSIVAIVVYFPLGIPAALFAFNIQKEFDAGILNGNIDKAQKYAGRAEKLIIFAGLFAILTLVLVVSLVERSRGSDNDNSLLTNRVLPGG